METWEDGARRTQTWIKKKVFFRTVQSPLVSVYVTAPSSGLFFDSCPLSPPPAHAIHICPGTCSS